MTKGVQIFYGVLAAIGLYIIFRVALVAKKTGEAVYNTYDKSADSLADWWVNAGRESAKEIYSTDPRRAEIERQYVQGMISYEEARRQLAMLDATKNRVSNGIKP